MLLVIAACVTPLSAQENNLDANPPSIIFVTPERSAPTPGVFFPEYCPGHPIATQAPYSTPDFAGDCYWVQKWNTPAFFAHTINDSMLVWPVVENEWDGVAYDIRILTDPQVKQSKVYFTSTMFDDRPVERYFRLNQLTKDPRLTNWWMSFVTDSAATLWEAVQSAAASDEYPEITRAIIEHIVSTGLTTESEIESLTPNRIKEILLAYTDVALNHHKQVVQETIGERRLTAEKFSALKYGDTLSIYFDDRFGPVLAPEANLVITKGDGVTLTVASLESEEFYECHWEDVAWMADFIAVCENRRSY
jgi:hypothetical protein